jgi:hypothetical protein
LVPIFLGPSMNPTAEKIARSALAPNSWVWWIPGPPDSLSPMQGTDELAQPLGVNAMEERDRPVPASARAWRPRATMPEELDDARTVLVVHRWDPRTGRCAACAADCPCPPALDAGRVLAEAGAWNTVPFTSPACPAGLRADSAPARTGARWLIRLIRRLPWVATSE